MHYNPAEWVILKFGGVRATGRAIGISFQAVSEWRKRKTVPTLHQKPILDKAKSMRLDIGPGDLISGRTVTTRR